MWSFLSSKTIKSIRFFQLREINLFEKEQLNDDFIKLNPQHCVPTINDDGFILWESRAIAIYLVEKNHPGGHALYPLDAQRRAVINQRLQFDANTLHPRIRAICVSISELSAKYQKYNYLFSIQRCFWAKRESPMRSVKNWTKHWNGSIRFWRATNMLLAVTVQHWLTYRF